MTKPARALRSHVFALAALGAVGLALVAPGCGGSVSPEELCTKACDCQGACPDGTLDECTQSLERAQEAAEDAGCGGEFDDYLACIDDLLDSCSTDIEAACGDEAEAMLSCGGVVDDDSPEDPSSGGDACAELYTELSQCPDYELSEPAPCTPEEQELAACYLDQGRDLCDPDELMAASEACQAL